MYYHEILQQNDKNDFMDAMKSEINNHTSKRHWESIKITNIKNNVRILPCVWSMRRKKDLITGKVVKWKARLNVDGSKQKMGIDYNETYAPVASLISVRLILIVAIRQKRTTKQLDLVQAFPQAPVEHELYTELPNGCTLKGKQ
jgi:Reverse transcriptase (RNA-dependent DNA polymerase)